MVVKRRGSKNPKLDWVQKKYGDDKSFDDFPRLQLPDSQPVSDRYDQDSLPYD